MSRTYLLVLLLGATMCAASQTVVLPYNPDVNQDSFMDLPDLLGFLPTYNTNFTPGEVTVDGQTLTEYIAALEEAAGNATSDTITIPMLSGTAPGQMLYWDGAEWTLVPTGQPGDALMLDGTTPTWRTLKTGCPDSLYLEYDPQATVDDGSCATLVVNGCTDPAYVEYDATANTDDGSCATLVVNGCTDADADNYDATANTDDGSCIFYGCMDQAYVEYDATASTDDGSCATLVGCTDSDVASMDGYNYDIVTIGDQCWFAENLRTTVYADGDLIPAGLTEGEWTSTTSGATAVYGEGSSTCNHYSPDIDACDDAQSLTEYGRLYNWYAVDDARGLCPSGWHVPTDGEWTELEDYITAQGFSGSEGTALKSTYGWYVNGYGTDDFGFSALPGGTRDYYYGWFGYAGFYGRWWSSSPSGGDAWYRSLIYATPVVSRNDFNPRVGFSVRCLRDAD